MQVEQSLTKKIMTLATKAALPITLSRAEIIPLKSGGSERHFYRIKMADQSFVFMEGGCLKTDIRPYVTVGTFLFKNGLGVPEILAYDTENQVMLLEDLGDNSLYTLLQSAATRQAVMTYYEKVLQFLAEMQIKATRSIEDCPWLTMKNFGYEALRWETDYFMECFLRQFCCIRIAKQIQLEQEFHLLASRLADEPRCFMHRDFQSQNIYLQKDRVRIIDFQSATVGLKHYDVASLLKDAYYVLEDNDRDKLLYFYLETLQKTWRLALDSDQFIQTFQLAGLQRNMQALGAFAFLTLAKGKKNFAQYIPGALSYLKSALDDIAVFPVLRGLVYQAERRLKISMNQKSP